jgi:hypothetical protein
VLRMMLANTINDGLHHKNDRYMYCPIILSGRRRRAAIARRPRARSQVARARSRRSITSSAG